MYSYIQAALFLNILLKADELKMVTQRHAHTYMHADVHA